MNTVASVFHAAKGHSLSRASAWTITLSTKASKSSFLTPRRLSRAFYRSADPGFNILPVRFGPVHTFRFRFTA